jgi:hypothetical protein
MRRRVEMMRADLLEALSDLKRPGKRTAARRLIGTYWRARCGLADEHPNILLCRVLHAALEATLATRIGANGKPLPFDPAFCVRVARSVIRLTYPEVEAQLGDETIRAAVAAWQTAGPKWGTPGESAGPIYELAIAMGIVAKNAQSLRVLMTKATKPSRT